jgi:guanylate kinase
MNNLLVVISAPSGTGKTTVCKKLLQELKDFKYSISYTTRRPREGEKEDIDYKFLTKEEFQNLLKEGIFIEWTKVYGNYYGTSKLQLQEYLTQNNDVLLDLDGKGAKAIKEIYKENVLLIYLLPPSLEELKKRLLSMRKEDEKTIFQRMKEFKEQLKYLPLFDYFVINKDLKTTISVIKSIIESAKNGRPYKPSNSECVADREDYLKRRKFLANLFKDL